MAANIDVILSRDIPNLGKIGDVVKVKPGYARNFLFPQKMSMPVSENKVAFFEHQKRMVEAKKQKLKSDSVILRDKLQEIQITLFAKVGKNGKLFGSISARDISKEIEKSGFNLDYRNIKLPALIKTVGLHEVSARLEGDVKVALKVVVAAEESESDEADKKEATVESTDSEQGDSVAAQDAENNSQATAE